MDPADLALRNETYRRFVAAGRAPSAAEVGAALGRSVADVLDGWRRLHDAHALVLDAARASIRMANPFSAVPTAYRVEAAGRWWYANCAWDAFGICAALHVDGRIETSCADCGEPLSVAVRDQRPDDADLLFHCLVPARYWWDDIVFT
ncbi:organomercurial lyase [Blastococcus sp. PRF04-17]|uniref:organomercurial lyase n=1 Tax=Blastococcus sp. PRF04-17 TaxID=2933797 RepID=UPI001FF58965|nr:organomercurial lyase [Blastococcus sp. PRF04-17]UOY03510.1 alkylmercury lyase family protein [Blastococcus sp. PRF04-17]